MTAPKNDLTAEFVRSIFDYNKKVGALFWKKTVSKNRKSRGGNSRSGKMAGNVFTNGYRYIYVNGRWYLAHRLIYLHRNGKWPANKIDHSTGDKLNNKKIRPADNSQNAFNKTKQSNNTSGFKGVTLFKARGRWRAQIAAYGQYESLGMYDTPEEAHKAYCKAAKRLHKEFANFS